MNWKVFIIIAINLEFISSSPITNPLGENSDISKAIPTYYDTKRGKAYHESIPTNLSDVQYIKEDNACDIEFRIRWSTTVGSSIFSSPVIFPSNTNGQKNIFQTTFYQYVEMISHDGFKPW
jgi:hypothetical protein